MESVLRSSYISDLINALTPLAPNRHQVDVGGLPAPVSGGIILPQQSADKVLLIYYPVDPTPGMPGYFKYTFEAFLLFVAGDQLHIRYLLSDTEYDAVKQMNAATDINTLPTAEKITVKEHLETAVYALMESLELKLPSGVRVPLLLQKRKSSGDDLSDMGQLFTLLGRGIYTKQKDINEIAEALYMAWSSPTSFITFYPDFFEEGDLMEIDEEEDYALFKHVLLTFIPAVYCGNQFSPGELELHIAALTGEVFELDLPEEETVQQALFEAVQQQLAETGLELLGLDTGEDHYCFMLVKKKDTDKVLSLAAKFRLPLYLPE
ncbi:MAG TPA: hypothetical protein VM802_26555 [Chitinophaga sp.]|uniref:DUF6630 family protein n=1 Tax=Chitinophaga sp. TaxID=1869181 RepID=UPI002CDD8C61|nr:hypothetical protein [Chitinophaga sp.]HVI48459.1 hypothetical protein [Chitinophaga sp.]